MTSVLQRESIYIITHLLRKSWFCFNGVYVSVVVFAPSSSVGAMSANANCAVTCTFHWIWSTELPYPIWNLLLPIFLIWCYLHQILEVPVQLMRLNYWRDPNYQNHHDAVWHTVHLWLCRAVLLSLHWFGGSMLTSYIKWHSKVHKSLCQRGCARSSVTWGLVDELRDLASSLSFFLFFLRCTVWSRVSPEGKTLQRTCRLH